MSVERVRCSECGCFVFPEDAFLVGYITHDNWRLGIQKVYVCKWCRMREEIPDLKGISDHDEWEKGCPVLEEREWY